MACWWFWRAGHGVPDLGDLFDPLGSLDAVGKGGRPFRATLRSKVGFGFRAGRKTGYAQDLCTGGEVK